VQAGQPFGHKPLPPFDHGVRTRVALAGHRLHPLASQTPQHHTGSFHRLFGFGSAGCQPFQFLLVRGTTTDGGRNSCHAPQYTIYRLSLQLSTRREVQKRETDIQKRERLLHTKEQDMQNQITRAVAATRKRTEQETSERIEKEHKTYVLQLQKALSDVKKQCTEMKRQLEQSSQQSQGEVMELELEKTLKAEFPADDITRITKGKFGADILHKVVSANGQHCGTIVWESNNSQKGWKKEWLTKLRSDQRREKAEIAVIVSSVLPKNMRCHFGQVTGKSYRACSFSHDGPR
jgi:hypothetical protein